MADKANETAWLAPDVVTMSSSLKSPFQLYVNRAMYFLNLGLPCVSSYLVPEPGSERIALTSSLLSLAIGNNISSGTPRERRVIDKSSMVRYTSDIKSLFSSAAYLILGWVVVGADRCKGL